VRSKTVDALGAHLEAQKSTFFAQRGSALFPAGNDTFSNALL
jgi:hypothetical protein